MQTLSHAAVAQVDHARSELEEVVLRLEQRCPIGPASSRRPRRLSLIAIKLEPDAFAVRGVTIDEHHLGQLARSLSMVKDLAPVLVLRCGDDFVLVDGHHRLVAYRAAARADIPVEVFEGTVREAVLEAALRNSQAVLQMDNRQRQDCGWRLVNAGIFTIDQTCASAGISRAQVSLMRRAKKDLGDEAVGFTEWLRAKRAADGRSTEPFTDEQVDAMKEALAQDYADRFRKEFGSKLATNPEITARALSIHLGRKLPDLMLWLDGELTEEGREWREAENDSPF